MKGKYHNLDKKAFYGMPAVLLGALAGVYYLWDNSVLLFCYLLITSIVQAWLTDFLLVRTYLTVALIGPMFEIVAIHSGAWMYSTEFVLGIPVWLPLLWGIAGICFVTAANFYNESRVK